MTEQQIDRERLRKRAEDATPGPWETRGYKEMPGKYVVGPRKPNDLGRGPVVLMEPLFCDERSAADAEFIAAARSAVPQILDQLDRAEARIKAVDALVTDLEQQPAEHLGWDAAAILPDFRRALDGTVTTDPT